MQTHESHLKFLISGLYSGPSPSAGLGIAMSLKAAWPSCTVTGMDYWDGASGLHHPAIDSELIFPAWEHINEVSHMRKIRDLLADHILIPSLDLEVEWMARNLRAERFLLAPDSNALQYSRKPYAKMADRLDLKRPAFICDLGNDQDIYEFARRHSWRIWIKGPFHGAAFVSSWRQLIEVREQMRQSSGESAHPFGGVTYYQHIRGIEESICFCAAKGEVIAAVRMEKKVTTPEGKTWSGRVTPLDHETMAALRSSVAVTGWTGGCELELIRDEDGFLWLNEINPRFPAWIYGATLAGFNLPALLAAKAFGLSIQHSAASDICEFTRVVTEIPVKSHIGLPDAKVPVHGQVAHGSKYGLNFANLSRKIVRTAHAADEVTGDCLDPVFLNDLAQSKTPKSTPFRFTLKKSSQERFEYARALQRKSYGGDARLSVAYSIKTCPDPEFLNLAHDHDLGAEAISLAEVESALKYGWKKDQIILNGPAKWWPLGMEHHQGLKAVFCDSLNEMERLINSGRVDVMWGLRLKVPGFNTRFGVDLSCFKELARAVQLIQQIPPSIKLGFHVHMASNLVGVGHWKDAVESALKWSLTISQESCRPIELFDLGGGYHPEDFKKIDFAQIVTGIKQMVPSIKEVVIEPGRALSQDLMGLCVSVQDIRHENGVVKEVVVDGCISELPLIRSYPHRIFQMRTDAAGSKTAIPFEKGMGRIYGRVCMEDDILANDLLFPEQLSIGDQLIFADAGGYERSMSYGFGSGSISDPS
jgi:diaminopimelate decarboxylase